MKDRIRQLMEAQHMNQQTFAKLTGISSATLSSIFNGRTNPSINQVTAIRKCFPSINLYWLLYGDGGMFESVSQADPDIDMKSAESLNADNNVSNTRSSSSAIMAEGMLDFGDADAVDSHSYSSLQRGAQRQSTPSIPQNVSRNLGVVSASSRKIAEIRVFYDDQTWETFVPKKN